MSRVRIPSKTWILVCDGSKALLFQNVGDERAINLKASDVLIEPHPPTRELGTDQPGRTYDSMDGSPAAVDTTDWHERAEVDFLRKVSEKLDEAVRVHQVKHVVVIAPPKALGILRGQLTPGVRAVLTAEIAKDLVKLPTPELERRLSAMGELPD